MFLNSFPPPRPYDISLRTWLLYYTWYLSTGIYGGFLPIWAIIRYMNPLEATSDICRGYAAQFDPRFHSPPPYPTLEPVTKVVVQRNSHTLPGLPDWFLFNVQSHWTWRLLEVLVGPDRCSNLHWQAIIAKRDAADRDYWRRCSAVGWKAGLVFGVDDPLLPEYKQVMESILPSDAKVDMPGTGWIQGLEHYPATKADAVADRIEYFLEHTRQA